MSPGKSPSPVLLFLVVRAFEFDYRGGFSAAVSKPVAAVIERVKLLIQNEDEMLKTSVFLNHTRVLEIVFVAFVEVFLNHTRVLEIVSLE
ncbi:hypothetical protein Tco_1018194 [Tanacetum coccineum]|uniref:Uncharacterized protein n=1 Tax=Tanacetum coccineum TaxID=301880 RepID=A0ABQ5FU15_9ASTR